MITLYAPQYVYNICPQCLYTPSINEKLRFTSNVVLCIYTQYSIGICVLPKKKKFLFELNMIFRFVDYNSLKIICQGTPSIIANEKRLRKFNQEEN